MHSAPPPPPNDRHLGSHDKRVTAASFTSAPPPPPNDRQHLGSHDKHVTAASFSPASLAQLVGIRHSYCISSPPLALGKSSVQEGKGSQDSTPFLSGRPGWSHQKLGCAGFNLQLDQAGPQDTSLALTVWPLSIAKSLFLNYG